MTRPFLHKCAGIAAFTAILAGFIVLRSSSLDQSYRDHLTSRTKKISSTLDAFFSKNEFSKDTIGSYLKETTMRHTDLALIAVSGDDGRVLLLSKNNAILAEPEIYDQVADEVYAGRFPASDRITITERYYQSRKFYILPARGAKGVLTLVFPRSLPVAFILRFILEIIAVGCIAAACIGMIYLTLQKRLGAPSAKQKKQPAAKEKEPKKPEPKPVKKAALKLEPFLLDRFSSIAGHTGAESIMLSTFNAKTGRPDTQLVSDGERIIKTKIKGETADTRVQILAELRRGSHILRDRSRKVLIPVVADGELAAVVSVSRSKKFEGKEISKIKQSLSGIAEFF